MPSFLWIRIMSKTVSFQLQKVIKLVEKICEQKNYSKKDN